MGMIFTPTLSCDISGCTAVTSTSLEEADVAGWSYGASSYGVNSMPPATTLRCPAHRGQ